MMPAAAPAAEMAAESALAVSTDPGMVAMAQRLAEQQAQRRQLAYGKGNDAGSAAAGTAVAAAQIPAAPRFHSRAALTKVTSDQL